ncbi:MAG TPA: hypothetical protein VF740_05360, partial [Candidatus Acidoferrum sp.]
SSYGYDIRVADEFRIFTNVNTTIVDPKHFDPRSRQACRPPCSGRMRLIPFFLRSSATRALVASLGQVQ